MKLKRTPIGTAFACVLLASAVNSHNTIWPVSGQITQNYYSNTHNHKAIDLAAPMGRAIGSTWSGKTTFRGLSGGYGRLVIVGHSNGYSSYYAHNSAYATTVGEAISQDEKIAE